MEHIVYPLRGKRFLCNIIAAIVIAKSEFNKSNTSMKYIARRAYSIVERIGKGIVLPRRG